jgi:hypothetical protein
MVVMCDIYSSNFNRLNMMQTVEKRALYNLLRMNWLNDTSLNVETWQVEDYRSLPLAELFERLKGLDIHLDKNSFIAHADFYQSPEELNSHLIGDRRFTAIQEDRLYLLVFELWRRLIDEKPSISIFCDELDQLIFSYDHNQLENPTLLQNALSNLLLILDENVDEGIEPEEAFKLISNYCANDLQTFLYDFIAEQIDEQNESYAHELLDDFGCYLKGDKWFSFLKARVFSHSNPRTAQRLFIQLIEDQEEDQDLEFHLELLVCMPEIGTPQLFNRLASQTIPLLKLEEDLQDFLEICCDYYQRLDKHHERTSLQQFIQKRLSRSLQKSIQPNDPDLKQLTTLLKV